MKKKLSVFLCMLLAMMLLGGCGEEENVLSKLKTEKYVTLGEYKGLEVSLPAVEVSEEYQQNYINYMLSTSAEWVELPADTQAQLGNVVNIDYEGKKDGVAFEGGTSAGYDLELGSGSFIPGFEEGLVGVKSGETRDLNLTFPQEYHAPELAGAEVVFTVKVNAVKEQKIPELNDEYVKGLDVGCNTVAEYEKYVYDLLLADMQATYEENLDTMLLEKAMEICTFKEPPAAMVDQYYDKAVRNLSKFATMNGMTLETMVTNYYGTTMEDFETEAREGAAISCKEAIMMQAIANAEGITVSEEEINAALEEAVVSGGYDSVEQLKADMGEDNYEDYVMFDKVLEVLRDNAVVTELEQ